MEGDFFKVDCNGDTPTLELARAIVHYCKQGVRPFPHLSHCEFAIGAYPSKRKDGNGDNYDTDYITVLLRDSSWKLLARYEFTTVWGGSQRMKMEWHHKLKNTNK